MMENKKKFKIFPKGKKIDVTILKVVDPAHFIVKECPSLSMSKEAREFLRLERELDELYSSLLPSGNCHLMKGEIVAVEPEGENKWYRGEINYRLSTTTGDFFNVYQLDYGKNCQVKRNRLFKIEEKFLTVPFQAVHFHLKALKPLSLCFSSDLTVKNAPSDQWDNSAEEYVSALCKDVAGCRVEAENMLGNGSMNGNLHFEMNSEEFCLNDVLISQNYAYFDHDDACVYQNGVHTNVESSTVCEELGKKLPIPNDEQKQEHFTKNLDILRANNAKQRKLLEEEDMHANQSSDADEKFIGSVASENFLSNNCEERVPNLNQNMYISPNKSDTPQTLSEMCVDKYLLSNQEDTSPNKKLNHAITFGRGKRFIYQRSSSSTSSHSPVVDLEQINENTKKITNKCSDLENARLSNDVRSLSESPRNQNNDCNTNFVENDSFSDHSTSNTSHLPINLLPLKQSISPEDKSKSFTFGRGRGFGLSPNSQCSSVVDLRNEPKHIYHNSSPNGRHFPVDNVEQSGENISKNSNKSVNSVPANIQLLSNDVQYPSESCNEKNSIENNSFIKHSTPIKSQSLINLLLSKQKKCSPEAKSKSSDICMQETSLKLSADIKCSSVATLGNAIKNNMNTSNEHHNHLSNTNVKKLDVSVPSKKHNEIKHREIFNDKNISLCKNESCNVNDEEQSTSCQSDVDCQNKTSSNIKCSNTTSQLLDKYKFFLKANVKKTGCSSSAGVEIPAANESASVKKKVQSEQLFNIPTESNAAPALSSNVLAEVKTGPALNDTSHLKEVCASERKETLHISDATINQKRPSVESIRKLQKFLYKSANQIPIPSSHAVNEKSSEAISTNKSDPSSVSADCDKKTENIPSPILTTHPASDLDPIDTHSPDSVGRFVRKQVDERYM